MGSSDDPITGGTGRHQPVSNCLACYLEEGGPLPDMAGYTHTCAARLGQAIDLEAGP